MRKSWKLLMLGAVLTVGMTISAAAANFTSSADALNEMGLFSGTGSGYELEREPTRAEAAVMLVRLLGGEKQATENRYNTPFIDVPAWAEPYVGWLYHNHLTAGMSETTYGTNGKCTAQMYSAFLLRSLGYQDSGSAVDFQYTRALDFAREKGVADYVNHDADHFLRDHVAAMSYTALSVQPKDGKHDTLLDQLIASDAIDAGKAAKTKSSFAAYQEYAKLSEKQASADRVAMTMEAAVAVKLDGAEIVNASMTMDVKAKMDMLKMDQSKLAMSGKMTMKLAEGLAEPNSSTVQNMDMAAYYENGMYYIKSGTDKIKMPMSFEAMLADLDMDMLSKQAPISMFESISKNSDGSYQIVYAPSLMNGMIEKTLTSMGMTDSTSVQMQKVHMVVGTRNGEISTMKADIKASAAVLGQKVEITMTADYVVTATGDKVIVTLPADLGTYVEMPLS